MKKRLCHTVLQKLSPCNIGWSNYTNENSTHCLDEPMEKNCMNIVDTKNIHCPYCDSILGVEDEEAMFGNNIREAKDILIEMKIFSKFKDAWKRLARL